MMADVFDAPLGAVLHQPAPPPGHPQNTADGWPGGGAGRNSPETRPSARFQKDSDSRYFIGVDIGGTFTDLVIARPEGDGFDLVKTLTTPDNPVRGVMQAVSEALDITGIRADRLQRVVSVLTRSK